MNKYQKALNELREISASQRQNELYDILQELVDKEIPTKYKKMPNGIIRCPKCPYTGIKYNRCVRRGQKIDWSESDE